jgi:hypothetical protein
MNSDIVWDNIAIVPFGEILKFLQIVKNNQNKNKTRLKELTGFSGGKFYNTFKSAKNMGLIVNGRGIKLIELGELWLRYYERNEDVLPELIRTACLNVPLFKEFYTQNPLNKDPDKIKEEFAHRLKKIAPNFRNTLIGAVVRRYLEGLHNFKFERYSSKSNFDKGIKPQNKNHVDSAIKILMSELNLTDAELSNIINAFPESKKQKVFENWFSYLRNQKI